MVASPAVRNDEIISLLRNLTNDIVLSPSRSTLNPSAYLAQAAPLFAALHTINRESLVVTKKCKQRTQDSRLEMDSQHLRLQNLMFERNHLEREIRKCEEFESEYQKLSLIPEDDFLALASSIEPPPGIDTTISGGQDPHELILARLNFELSERQRLDDEKKELVLAKAALVKENEKKKKRLEELEKQLEDFVASARSIQTKMHQ